MDCLVWSGIYIFIITLLFQLKYFRFFCQDVNDTTGKQKNVQAGTCIDHGPVSDNFFEFYMYAHAGIMGTSRPAHYLLLHDDNNLSPESLKSKYSKFEFQTSILTFIYLIFSHVVFPMPLLCKMYPYRCNACLYLLRPADCSTWSILAQKPRLRYGW